MIFAIILVVLVYALFWGVLCRTFEKLTGSEDAGRIITIIIGIALICTVIVFKDQLLLL